MNREATVNDAQSAPDKLVGTLRYDMKVRFDYASTAKRLRKLADELDRLQAEQDADEEQSQ